jgi:hypothetical protein
MGYASRAYPNILILLIMFDVCLTIHETQDTLLNIFYAHIHLERKAKRECGLFRPKNPNTLSQKGKIIFVGHDEMMEVLEMKISPSNKYDLTNI